MARSISYNAEWDFRRYPPELFYGGAFGGREITEDTVFNEVRIRAHIDLYMVYRVDLLNDGTFVSEVPGWRANTPVFGPIRFDRDDPEVLIARNAIRGGTRLTFQVRDENPLVVIDRAEFHSNHWLTDLLHPFHDDDKDLFMERLTEHLEYDEPEDDRLPHFLFPGIIEGHNRTFYKREDDAGAPDVRDVDDLAAQGWTAGVPLGSDQLYAIDLLDGKDAVSIGHPRRVYHRRKDLDGNIRAVARKWHEYWRGLTTSEKGINVRLTLEKHVKHAIGRAWAEKPYHNGIRVFHERESGARQRSFQDAEDWMVGNLEQWAHSLGFNIMAAALADGGNRVALDVQLDDYTFCIIKPDGTVGDRLANPNEGILDATWNGWATTHYNAALGTIVEDVSAGADVNYHVSETPVRLEGMGTVLNAVGMPVMLWERVSGYEATLGAVNMASLSFTGPAMEAGDDPIEMVLKFTISNNGESDSDTVTVTFNAPAGE